MTLIVPHRKTRQQAIDIVDRGANDLFAGFGGGSVQIVNFRKSWKDSVMSFSFTGSVGFISIPLAGTVTVDDANVVIECELPAIVTNFIGEDTLKRSIEPRIAGLLSA